MDSPIQIHSPRNSFFFLLCESKASYAITHSLEYSNKNNLHIQFCVSFYFKHINSICWQFCAHMLCRISNPSDETISAQLTQHMNQLGCNPCKLHSIQMAFYECSSRLTLKEIEKKRPINIRWVFQQKRLRYGHQYHWPMAMKTLKTTNLQLKLHARCYNLPLVR